MGWGGLSHRKAGTACREGKVVSAWKGVEGIGSSFQAQ